MYWWFLAKTIIFVVFAKATDMASRTNGAAPGLWRQWIFHPLATLCAWAVFLRFFSFFPSVINHDESTYLVIAQGLLEGKTYFIDLIDTKPAGIFLLYAGLWLAAGKTIWGMRLLTALWVGLTGYALYQLGRRAADSARTGWAAGFIYISMVSLFTFYGVSPNTELYFVLFTVAAIALIWNQRAVWRYALAGLLLGMGFITKYVVFFDGLAIGLFWAWQGRRRPGATLFRQLLPLVAGAALPFVLAYAWYAGQGHADVFRFYTFEVMGRYPVDKVWWRSGLHVLDFFARFLPVTLMAYWRLRRPLRSDTDALFTRFLLLWIGFALVAALYTGKLFGHYFIPVMAPLALLAGGFFQLERQRPQWIDRISPRIGWTVLAVFGLLVAGLQWTESIAKPDRPRAVAQWLQQRMAPTDQLYTGDYHQIIYLLLDKESPTPYIHRSLVWDPHHRQALGIDINQETRRILGSQPRFVLLQDKAPYNELKERILAHYALVHTFPFGVEVYELKSPGQK